MSDDMQEKQTVKSFVMPPDSITNLPVEIEAVYTCTACRRMMKKTALRLTAGEIKEMMMEHKCRNPGKSDFEEELRHAGY